MAMQKLTQVNNTSKSRLTFAQLNVEVRCLFTVSMSSANYEPAAPCTSFVRRKAHFLQ